MKIKAYFLGEDVDLHVWISEEGNLEEKWRCLESLGGENHVVFHNVEIYGE